MTTCCSELQRVFFLGGPCASFRCRHGRLGSGFRRICQALLVMVSVASRRHAQCTLARADRWATRTPPRETDVRKRTVAHPDLQVLRRLCVVVPAPRGQQVSPHLHHRQPFDVDRQRWPRDTQVVEEHVLHVLCHKRNTNGWNAEAKQKTQNIDPLEVKLLCHGRKSHPDSSGTVRADAACPQVAQMQQRARDVVQRQPRAHNLDHHLRVRLGLAPRRPRKRCASLCIREALGELVVDTAWLSLQGFVLGVQRETLLNRFGRTGRKLFPPQRQGEDRKANARHVRCLSTGHQRHQKFFLDPEDRHKQRAVPHTKKVK